MSLLTAKVHRKTDLRKWEKKRNAERKKKHKREALELKYGGIFVFSRTGK